MGSQGERDMKCGKCENKLLRFEEGEGLCALHKPNTPRTYENRSDYDYSEDGPFRSRKNQGGQWSRLREDDGMTGID